MAGSVNQAPERCAGTRPALRLAAMLHRLKSSANASYQLVRRPSSCRPISPGTDRRLTLNHRRVYAVVR
jgi:hypothetical protein